VRRRRRTGSDCAKSETDDDMDKDGKTFKFGRATNLITSPRRKLIRIFVNHLVPIGAALRGVTCRLKRNRDSGEVTGPRRTISSKLA